MPTQITKINNAAGSQTHGLKVKTDGSLAYPTSVPRLGTLSGNPKPRYVSETSIPILPASIKVASTMIIELRFGSSSFKIIFKSLLPEVFEALM